MNIKAIFISTGYAETGRLGRIIFVPTNNKNFANKVEAVKSLASELFNKWKRDNCYDNNPDSYSYNCCERISLRKTNPFCSKCGQHNKDKPNSVFKLSFKMKEQYLEWIENLPGEIADSYSEELPNWCLWNFINSILPLSKANVIELNDDVSKLFLAIIDEEYSSSFLENCKVNKKIPTLNKIIANMVGE